MTVTYTVGSCLWPHPLSSLRSGIPLSMSGEGDGDVRLGKCHGAMSNRRIVPSQRESASMRSSGEKAR